MADGNTTQRLAQSFDNSSPGAAVAPCCKNVKGEWKEIPHFTVSGVEYLGPGGIYQTYYLDVIPKGLKVTVRVRVNGRIKGTLVCKCMDDGRTLSESKVDLPYSVDLEAPVYATNYAAKLIPGIGWVVLAYEVANAAKQAYDLYSANPEFAKKLIEQAGPAAKEGIQKVINSADELCKNKHKCTDPAPAPPDDGPLVS